MTNQQGMNLCVCVCVSVCVCDSQLLQEVQVGQSSTGQHSQIIHTEVAAERQRETD